MMVETYSISQDLKEAQALVNALVPYVYQDQLYGNAGGGFFSRLPALTLGGILLRLKRLDVLQPEMTDKQRTTFDSVIEKNADIAKEWRSHYEGKMLREANSRLDAMRMYFNECASNMKLCASQYLPEALRRTTVQVLLEELKDWGVEDDDLTTKVRARDGELRRYVQPSDFVWSPSLASVYDSKVYWWLYNRPVAPEK